MNNISEKDKNFGTVKAEKEKKVYHVEVALEGIGDGDESISLSYRFKEPAPVQFNRYVKEVSKDLMKAAKNLLFSNVFPEDRDQLEQDCEKYPGLLLTISPKFLGMLGVTDNVSFHRIRD